MIVRLTLAALFAVPAAMAYPWQSTGDRWLLGVAFVVMVLLFSWWRGLFVTTIFGRRIAMLLRRTPVAPESRDDAALVKATVALRVAGSDTAEPPLELLAGYLDRYGIRFDKVRVVSRDAGAVRTTWVSLTLAAADNLAALSARSPRLPLRDTADMSGRRLADHLRELGWDVTTDEPPALVPAGWKETWRSVTDGDAHLAAYRVTVDDDLPATFDSIRASGADEVWTVLELTGSRTQPDLTAGCALRTAQRPQSCGPLPGLTPHRGRHRDVLAAMHPGSDQRLPGPPGPAPVASSLTRT